MANHTNTCCRAGGSNLNAGTRTGSTTEPGTGADFTYASGSLVASTRVFTVPGGANPLTDGVAVGDWVSIFANGASVTGYVARVTAVTSTTITTDATAKSGTIPTDGTNNRTLRVGGAWAGPSGASGFPLTFLTAASTDAAGNPARINLKNDQTYAVTASMALPAASAPHVAGYASAYGDGGRAVLDGGTSGASYILMNMASAASDHATFADIEWRNNGATGTATGVSLGSPIGAVFRRCVFRDFRGNGVSHTMAAESMGATFAECEFHGCNQGNGGNLAALLVSSGCVTLIRCTFHDNAGSNGAGVLAFGGSARAYRCIFDANGAQGLYINVSGSVAVNCDFHGNGSHGIMIAAGISAYIENSNFVANGGWGINNPSGVLAAVVNCGFGSGTAANASGTVALPAFAEEVGTVTYPADVTPWADPAAGDFTITLAQAKGAGRGSFLQAATGYGGTTAAPDIGAAQSAGGKTYSRGRHVNANG
jgi:hypothetical protein